MDQTGLDPQEGCVQTEEIHSGDWGRESMPPSVLASHGEVGELSNSATTALEAKNCQMM